MKQSSLDEDEEDFPGLLLHQAALWENAELLEDLLEGDQIDHINSPDSWGRTPLHTAAMRESGCLRVLLQAGADPNIPAGPRCENRTPLHLSAENGFTNNILLLLAHKADITARDLLGLTALDIARKAEHEECVDILTKAQDARELSRHASHQALREAVLSGDLSLVKVVLHELTPEAELIVNLAPNGATTLLYCASESGKKALVKLLLDHGADGRIHPVTKYSPLYIAAFKGHKDIVEVLLKTFPELIQQYTVERWLPLHAAVINGHLAVTEFILKYPYPPHLMSMFKDREWEYQFPFDLNLQDVSGQTVLYLACFLGHAKLVDLLLKFKVKASRKPPPQAEKSEAGDGSEGVNPDGADILSPTRRRISDGIQSIMSRLSLSSRPSGQESNEKLLSPWRVDAYCNNGVETALHAAVGGKHHEIATGLVNTARANVNLSTRPNSGDQSNSPRGGCEESVTPLVLACSNRDLSTVDLLLRAGARDDDCKALAVVVAAKDDVLTAKLLAIKAFPDPEYKINKKAQSEGAGLYRTGIAPHTPVMINWHAQRCELTRVRAQWLIDAGLHVNPKLRLHPRTQGLVLTAITRLDLSHNSLPWAPPALFLLPSLRVLNLAQNKIERLPSPLGGDFEQTSPLHGARRSKETPRGYWLPLLEELYLQFNRLESIPDEIFQLPSLLTLDVSNNKLQSLSSQLWRTPKLKELNVAFNLLKDLPAIHNSEDTMSDAGSVCSVESSRSGESNPDPLAPSSQDCDTRFKETRLSNIKLLPLTHHNVWSHAGLEVSEHPLPHSGGGEAGEKGSETPCCPLLSLNLAHNQFTSVPPVLPCLAVNLTKLNMAYNSLRSMSHITSYPNSLKQLDLSHNKISCWPSLPQIDSSDPMELAAVTCYCPDTASSKSHPSVGPLLRGRQSLRTSVLSSVCIHRRHLRLDSLRTLLLADNNVTRIQLSTDDDGEGGSEEAEGEVCLMRTRLMFPNLSMLDLSNNHLRDIPPAIHELANLSVLNVSNNRDITELPYQMGLLHRLWNLNTRGCCLQEPLRSMLESNKYKTMDILGYLKSVLEDAKPYARMKLMIVGVQGIGKTSLLEQLRQEGVRSYKKKPTEHWAKRMGNKNINTKNSRGANMSTVGVDIGDWVYERRGGGGGGGRGAVQFRTWDFGGQREYYATHQYFLSKRSLYLVVWKIPDGQPAIQQIMQWLVNIQARAPNSPCLIVGTHYDQVQERFPASRSEDLQQLIRDRFINIVDAEKCGLPRVLDTIEISCKTRHNIKLLCNLIYDTVFSLRPPGSKELLLEQKIPASYLALEDVVVHLAADRKTQGLDPVLTGEQYSALVTAEMSSRCHRTFRDAAELHQATLFLHDNGVLLHYDDVTLRDLYFLDPQWLCDMLAHVVTIREINPFARAGLMQLSDLSLVFKNTRIGSLDTKGYIVNLLNKFEVALTWDSRMLLIPSLLPTEPDLGDSAAQIVKVKIPVRTRGWAVRHKKISATSNVTGGPFFTPTHDPSSATVELSSLGEEGIELSTRGDPETAIRRLLLLSYFPSGFWSRLMTRILADDSIVDIVRAFFIIPKQVLQNAKLSQAIDKRAEWILWQTGMELRFSDTVLFRMREVSDIAQPGSVDYRAMNLRIKQEGVWQEVDLASASILEVLLPSDTIVIKQPIRDENEPIGYQAIVLEPSPERTAQLLALAVDHIDVLLEDWYPTLGTRFVHTSEGKFLVTRLIPCPRCLVTGGSSESVDPAYVPPRPPSSVPAGSDEQWEREGEWRGGRKSQESYASDGDSGVGRDSTCSSRKPSMEGHPLLGLAEEVSDLSVAPQYSWMVEECILAAYDRDTVKCPVHGDTLLAHVAPDTMFLDLGDRHLIRPHSISRGKLLGRGAFGFVFKGSCKARGCSIDVAMKMLQPVQPGPGASESAQLAWQGAQGKWARDPLQYASKAYTTARQELNILLSLRHSNIVPLVGVCTRPLALVLDLAPLGALDAMLRHYRRSGATLTPSILQQTILQVAKALEYLHQQHIIYRDLKSENVLVWSMPQPFDTTQAVPVHIKLADYGISRLTLPSGTKGFGGTEGFMAPEIMRYNGEEEYTEKVDCFSFGMFLYELLSLRQPFESHEAVKECILEGGRPPLTPRDTQHPAHCLDLMVLCWAHSPRSRPSASQIVSIASAPEFPHLQDVIELQTDVVAAACSGGEVWVSAGGPHVDLLLASERAWRQYASLELPAPATALCVVADGVWLGDSEGRLHAYAAADARHLFSYLLLEDPCPVTCLLHLPEMQRVAAGLANGRIFLVADLPPASSGQGEGSFVLTELGASPVLHAAAWAGGELWCGESGGNISVYTMREGSVTSHEAVSHFSAVDTQSPMDVTLLVACGAWVCSYVAPGCVLYQWDAAERVIRNKLDCSKLVPCSESLLEEPLLAAQCHLTSLAAAGQCLYIGTAWGCVVVADQASLCPLTVFRPHEALVSAIVPLGGDIVTLGRGYRSLIARYTGGDAPQGREEREGYFALLWSSQNWAAA